MKCDDAFYQTILNQLFDGVYTVDMDRQITFWNHGAEKISGYSNTEALGKRCSDGLLMHMDEGGNLLCKVGCPLGKTLLDGKPREVEAYIHHKYGHRVPVLIRTYPITDDSGGVTGAVEIFCDNTPMVAARRKGIEMQRQSDMDALTQVFNRRFGEVQLASALKAFGTYQETFAVLFIDVDHFKAVNDHHGHAVGDQMLKLVADTLRYSIRTSDFVCRWGGEEFLVILYDTNLEQLATIYQKLRSLVARNVLSTEKGEVRVTISAGGTLVQEGETIKTLLERVDHLLYESKKQGTDRITIR